jgi:hypothetical protein
VVGELSSERAAAGREGPRAAGLAQLSAKTRTNPSIGEGGARGVFDGAELGAARRYAGATGNWTGNLVQMVIDS